MAFLYGVRVILKLLERQGKLKKYGKLYDWCGHMNVVIYSYE